MHEYLLNTKILYVTGAAQTGDFTWLVILLLGLIAVAASLIVFKKKALSVFLSVALVFGFMVVAPTKSFGDEKVSITPSAELEEDTPVQLTITNNDNHPISINSVQISNHALPVDTTWDITFIKDSYEIAEAKSSENVCVDIPANSTLTLSVYPNVSEIPAGELCNFTFNAVSNHYTSTFVNKEDSVSSHKSFDFSFNDFVNADNTQLNRNIATMEAVFAAIPNTYNNFILENKSYEVSDRLVFMRTLGFHDNYYCKLWPDQQPTIQADPGVNVTVPTYSLDINDVTSYCFNHRKINYGSHETEIINISVGATGGSFEWASNFDFGASEDTDYWDATGQHPEWTNHNNHKGFDIAKNRLLAAYNDYCRKYIDDGVGVDKIVLINGHSRGGAIANVLGDYFEDLSQNQKIKPFTYTLASPNVTAISPTNGDTTIFNIVNRDDIVALIPGNVSLFYKYGQDVDMTIFEGTSITGALLKDVFLAKSGYGQYNGNDPDDTEALIEEISILIEDRESAYTLNASASKEYTKVGSYDSEALAKADIPVFQQHLNEKNLSYYAQITGVEQSLLTGKWSIKFKCCAAFIMQDLSNFIFVYKGDTDKYKPSLAYNETLLNILLQAIGVAGGVTHSHIWTSYYLLSNEGDYNINRVSY